MRKTFRKKPESSENQVSWIDPEKFSKIKHIILRIMVKLLAQRPITLVLMINSCSYSINDLVFIKFQIFNQDLSRFLSSIKNSKSSFEANTC